jgi:hypothetical protein
MYTLQYYLKSIYMIEVNYYIFFLYNSTENGYITVRTMSLLKNYHAVLWKIILHSSIYIVNMHLSTFHACFGEKNLSSINLRATLNITKEPDIHVLYI